MSKENLHITELLGEKFLSDGESDPFTEQSVNSLLSLLKKRISTITTLTTVSREKVRTKKITEQEAKALLQKEFENATIALHENIKSIFGKKDYSPALHLAITYQFFALLNDAVDAGDIPTTMKATLNKDVKKYYPWPKVASVKGKGYLSDIYSYETTNKEGFLNLNKSDLAICWYLLRHLLDITPQTEAEKAYEAKKESKKTPEKQQPTTPFFSELRNQCISKLKSNKSGIKGEDIDSLFVLIEDRLVEIETAIVEKGDTFSGVDGRRVGYNLTYFLSTLKTALFRIFGSNNNQKIQFATAIDDLLSDLAKKHSLSTLQRPDVGYTQYAEEFLAQEAYLPYALMTNIARRLLDDLQGVTGGEISSRIAKAKAEKRAEELAAQTKESIEAEDIAVFPLFLEIEKSFLTKLNQKNQKLSEFNYRPTFLYLRSRVTRITTMAKDLPEVKEKRGIIYNETKVVPHRILSLLSEELAGNKKDLTQVVDLLLDTVIEFGIENEIAYNASGASGKYPFYEKLGDEESIEYSLYRHLVEFTAQRLDN